MIGSEMGLSLWLSSVKVYGSLHQFIPVSFVVLLQVVGQDNYLCVKLLYPSIYVRLLGIRNRSEFMLLLDYFWVVPKLRRSLNVLDFLSVIGCFHVFELLCCFL